MEGTLQTGSSAQSLADFSTAERMLSERDPVLAKVIASQSHRWPIDAHEHPIWGLVRMVIAQQISTRLACRLADRLKTNYLGISSLSSDALPDLHAFRTLGIPERRAQCCVTILQKSDEILEEVKRGTSWEQALSDIKGIGPWTLSVFRILVLRQPDELPIGDVGLQRAIANVYGTAANIEHLSSFWRPFRSVACWYLWRTLGNEQLG